MGKKKQSIKKKRRQTPPEWFSWKVIEWVAATFTAVGLALMPVHSPYAAYIADGLFVITAAVLCVKTLGEYGNNRTRPVVAMVATLMFYLGLIGLNQYMNDLYPFELVSHLKITCMATGLQYKADTEVAGVRWSPDDSEIRVIIRSNEQVEVDSIDRSSLSCYRREGLDNGLEANQWGDRM